jgi:hypothetical protein
MRRLAIGLLLLAGAGCTTREGMDLVDPILLEHRERVEVQESERAREKVTDEIRGKAEWTVRDCIDLACLHNDRLLARGETYYQAVLARDIITAGALPSVSARATYYRQETTPGFSTDPGSGLRARDEEFLRAEVPLFAGFREWNARAGATENIDAAAAALRHQKGLISVLVVEGFYGVLRKRSSAIDASSRLNGPAARDGARHKAGIARKTELLLTNPSSLDESSRAGRPTISRSRAPAWAAFRRGRRSGRAPRAGPERSKCSRPRPRKSAPTSWSPEPRPRRGASTWNGGAADPRRPGPLAAGTAFKRRWDVLLERS